ncbi:MAG: DNA-binding protein [Proteobacteria bacterium]|nr:DNA-binding protein [Pseudomonadota bacterium]
MRDIKRTAKPGEISVIFGLDTGTLANMRSQKRGPRYYKQGRGVFYFLEDVEAWLKQNPMETIDSIKG